MEFIMKLGGSGRLYISKKIREAMDLEKGHYVAVDVTKMKIEKIVHSGEDSDERKK